MLLTFAPEIVPAPLATVQVWDGFDGCVTTATEYALPELSAAGNEKTPLPETASGAPEPFCSCRPDPERPLTEPPTVYCIAGAPFTPPPPQLAIPNTQISASATH